jgi:hypothetical protein
MRAMLASSTLLMALACNGGGKAECEPEAAFEAFEDADGDGYGVASVGRVCALADGQAEEDGDCDDTNRRVHPEAEERCNGKDDDCDDALDDGLEGRVFYADADGDGFGNEFDALTACAAPEGMVDDDRDCDDAEETINPRGTEICGPADEDCDGLVDDEDDTVDPASMTPFYFDGDLDGYGDPDLTRSSCAAPDGAADNGDDCDDDRAEVNPGAPEVCNRRDDDCDTVLDHLDDSIDPALLVPGFADADSDGHGDPAAPLQTCGFLPGIAAEYGDDCDDTDAQIRPGRLDTPCDGVDNDCDAATIDNPDRDLDGTATCDGDCDDFDDTIHPGAPEIPSNGVDSDCDGEEDCYRDLDGDGLRTDVATPGGADPTCRQAPNAPETASVDCDDGDAAIDWSGDWVADGDGDGFGGGGVTLTDTCADPGAGYAPVDRPEDCDDVDPDVFPGAVDLCNDSVDGDCNGSDVCRTCDEWLDSDPLLPSDVYDLAPDGDRVVRVFCDMENDGGGWTLISVSEAVGLSTDNLSTTDASTLDLRGGFLFTGGLWSGMAPALGDVSDLRFTCTSAPDVVEVDLSFYGVSWYQDNLETGCFLDAGNPGPTPHRRNNLTGEEKDASDPYDSGALVGEEYCGGYDDFTVDFDDAGMNSNEIDGTDWGRDDFVGKCGDYNYGYGWYVWVR